MKSFGNIFMYFQRPCSQFCDSSSRNLVSQVSFLLPSVGHISYVPWRLFDGLSSNVYMWTDRAVRNQTAIHDQVFSYSINIHGIAGILTLVFHLTIMCNTLKMVWTPWLRVLYRRLQHSLLSFSPCLECCHRQEISHAVIAFLHAQILNKVQP